MQSSKEQQEEIRKPSSESGQWKEIEENNRMGKTRDLCKKMRDTKGTVHAKYGLDQGQKWYGPNRSRRY